MTSLFGAQDARLNAINDAINELRNHMSVLDRKCMDLDNRCTALRSDVDNLSETVTGVADEHYTLRAMVRSISLQIKEIETKHLILTQDLTLIKTSTDEKRTESTIGDKNNSDHDKNRRTYADAMHDRTSRYDMRLNVTSSASSNPNPTMSHKGQHQEMRGPIKGNGKTNDLIHSVERSKKIHACFFATDTTADTVKQYMETIAPGGNYTSEKLNLKHQYYASFMLMIPESKFELFMKSESWPSGIEVREWFRKGPGRASRTRRHPAPGQDPKKNGSADAKPSSD